MQTGDIVIVSFPYTDLISFKARPAVVVTETNDNYNDVIVSLISSVVPSKLSRFQILIRPDTINNLKVVSVIKVSRIATVENTKVVGVIGKLAQAQSDEFKKLFKSLVDQTT
jgi:mRNA interferase MazF